MPSLLDVNATATQAHDDDGGVRIQDNLLFVTSNTARCFRNKRCYEHGTLYTTKRILPPSL